MILEVFKPTSQLLQMSQAEKFERPYRAFALRLDALYLFLSSLPGASIPTSVMEVLI
jgi:hypothetical protein